MPQQLWGMDTRKQSQSQSQGLYTGGDVPASSGQPNTAPMGPNGVNGFQNPYGGMEAINNFTNSQNTPSTQQPTSGKKRWTPADWEEAMQALFTRLNKGLDFNDPRTQAILKNARATTMQSANDRGIYGGYSEGQAEGSYIKAAAGLQDAQDSRALQALGMGSGFSRGLANDAYGRAMDEYGQGMEDAGGLGSLIGGGLGGLAGGIVGAFGGPGGIAAGAKAGWDFGSGVGAGVGQMGYSGSHPRPTYGGY